MDFTNDDWNTITIVKHEFDSDEETSDTSLNKDPVPYTWNSENTLQFIRLLQNEGRELWDSTNPLYYDRKARSVKVKHFANIFNCTANQILNEISHLKNQYQSELIKLERDRGIDPNDQEDIESSCWEYFDALSFLSPQQESTEAAASSSSNVQIALSAYEVPGISKPEDNPKSEPDKSQPSTSFLGSIPSGSKRTPVKPKERAQLASCSCPPPIPAASQPMHWPDEPAVPRIRPSTSNPDECQIFGDFVASELRSLRTDALRKKLKRLIKKAILEAEEEEDEARYN